MQHSVANDTKCLSGKHFDKKILCEYERQLFSLYNAQCIHLYSDYCESFDFSGCTYYHVNNPSLGIFEDNTGKLTPCDINLGKLNGKQQVSLNSSCFDNQHVAATASQYVNPLIGEDQPHHQCHNVGHHRGSQSRTDVGIFTWCTIMFSNKYWQDTATGNKTYLIFISNGGNLQKFCFWNTTSDSGIANITECTDVEVGYIKIVSTVVIPVLLGKSFSNNVAPRLTYDNYTKDIWYTKTYGFSYTTYMERLIYNLILQQDSEMVSEANDSHHGRETALFDVRCRSNTACVSLPSHINVVTEGVVQDFNDSSKNRGFLNHGPAKFIFIGPDREMKECNDIHSYINMARVIQESGVPNYKGARFPLQSGLNIDVWRHHLRDYPDKFLIQYLTYGFPLSTIEPYL